MSDHIEVIDDDGHTLGWCRAVHESHETPQVLLHEWEPNTPLTATSYRR